jgi:hypothetical protein
MVSLSLDAALNLLWVAIALAALCGLAVLDRRHYRDSKRRVRLLRVCAVLLVSVSLFPAVSYSDDLFSLSFLQTHFGQHDGVGNAPPEDSRDKDSLQLARLLQTLEHYQPSGFCWLALAPLWVALIFGSQRRLTTRAVMCRPGRSPPHF